MTYCINPACPKPANDSKADRCQACGSELLLRDRYRVIKLLGQGGFGATFVARDRSLPGNPICVIKQLRIASKSPDVLRQARELFAREAKTLGKVGNHPQVPRLLDYFDADRQFYLVQEYVKGHTIKQEVKKNGPYDEQRVLDFLKGILPLLQYLHDNEVIHRDIKPANIIRRDIDNQLVLIDFGAVKDEVSQTQIALDEQTAFTSMAIGTPGFAPPEQMSLRPVYASDIYALGATCLFMLTGKSPNRLGYDPITSEIAWRDKIQVSDRLFALLEKMLEVSVRHRYQSAGQVLYDLDRPATVPTPDLEAVPTANTVPSNANDRTAVYAPPPPPPPTPVRRPPTPPPQPKVRDEEEERSQMVSGLAANPAFVRRSRRLREKTGGMSGNNSFSRMAPKRSSSASGKWNAKKVKIEYAQGGRDFSEGDLSGLNLQKFRLREANFHESQLTNTNLKEADLSGADLSQSNLNGAILRDAVMVKAYMTYANLGGADLRGADLTEAYLRHANLRGANLCGANLTDAKVTPEQLEMAKTNWLTVMPNGKRGLFA